MPKYSSLNMLKGHFNYYCQYCNISIFKFSFKEKDISQKVALVMNSIVLPRPFPISFKSITQANGRKAIEWFNAWLEAWKIIISAH